MVCKPCAFIVAVCINAAVMADMLTSAILLGEPGDTISARCARARLRGARWAVRVCAALTWVGKTVFRANRDHCEWAISDQPPIGKELWHW